MTEERAKEYLQDLASYKDVIYPNDLRQISEMLQSLRDELDSVWMMLEEMRQSDVLNHQEEITKRINDLFGQKSKIAKVSEA